MIEAADPHAIATKRKAISTIIIFAISLERNGQQEMLDLAVRALRWAPRWERVLWRKASQHTDKLFEESSSPSMNRVIALISPYRYWSSFSKGEKQVGRWATAVLAVPYTEEVGRSVVDTTLQIASEDSLRRHIPIGVWALFKERPSLPPTCPGRSSGTKPDVIRYVRGLGDLQIFKSYFLLIWSEWEHPQADRVNAMEISIREDFGGTEMGQHREDLVQRLDHILGELDRGLGYFKQHTTAFDSEDDIREAKEGCEKLKGVVLDVERKAAVKTLACTSPRLIFSAVKLISMDVAQDTTQPVPCPSRIRDFPFGVVLAPSQRSYAVAHLVIPLPGTSLLILLFFFDERCLYLSVGDKLA